MSTVLITGCSTGFGKLAALSFAREGHTVFASMRDLGKAGPLQDAADAEGLKITLVQLDVVDTASIERAVSEVGAEAGAIDILVNNAGMEVRGPIEEVSDSEARLQFDTNVFGLLGVIRAVLPAMRERGSGVIVNVASVGGVLALRGRGPYCATKAGLVHLTKSMAAEYAGRGLRCNAIGPGWMDTPFIRWRLEDPELAAPMLAKIPAGRVVSPEEIAEMVVFLASPGGAYLHGAHLIADGAMSTTIA